MSIRFGNSGWRPVIADEFTFAGVRKVTEAICVKFHNTAHSNPMVVGHVFETPVGFTYIGELINEDKIILGGEESAGWSIKGHYPEKDGILACLLAAEAVTARGASLSEQLKTPLCPGRQTRVGRIGVRLRPELMSSLARNYQRDASEIGGRHVEQTNRTDGVKFNFRGRFVVTNTLGDRTARPHSCEIRISKGLGGAS